MKNNILITGITGPSGLRIVQEFIHHKVNVKALVRNRGKAAVFENNPYVTLLDGDMTDMESSLTALAGIDKVLMISSARDDLYKTQTTFTNYAKAAGVKHILKYSGSDSGVGFVGHNFIAQREHQDVETYVVDSGLDWTIVRPSQFMEFYLPGYPTGVTLKENALILPIGKGKLSPVAIDDVAKACFKIMTEDGHEGKIYEMTGPDAFDMNEACEIISAATGLSIVYKSISLNDYALLFEKIGLKGKPVQILLQLSKERAKCTESHIHLGTHRQMKIRPTNFSEFIYRNRYMFNVAS